MVGNATLKAASVSDAAISTKNTACFDRLESSCSSSSKPKVQGCKICPNPAASIDEWLRVIQLTF